MSIKIFIATWFVFSLLIAGIIFWTINHGYHMIVNLLKGIGQAFKESIECLVEDFGTSNKDLYFVERKENYYGKNKTQEKKLPPIKLNDYYIRNNENETIGKICPECKFYYPSENYKAQWANFYEYRNCSDCRQKGKDSGLISKSNITNQNHVFINNYKTLNNTPISSIAQKPYFSVDLEEKINNNKDPLLDGEKWEKLELPNKPIRKTYLNNILSLFKQRENETNSERVWKPLPWSIKTQSSSETESQLRKEMARRWYDREEDKIPLLLLSSKNWEFYWENIQNWEKEKAKKQTAKL